MKLIPYGRQHVSRDDIRAVVKALSGERITQGPRVAEFEKALAARTGAKYAVAVSSGTAALHIACLAAGLGPDTEAVTSPISFVATANSILYCGARVVFSDVEPDTANLDAFHLKRQINSKTKVLLPVHYAGHPADMPRIKAAAEAKDVFVIEDACHALGARYKAGSKWYNVGSCAHSDACVFSFHPVKAITTGEGGAVTTNNPWLYERLLRLRTHSMIKDEKLFQNRDMAFSGQNGARQSAGGQARAAAPWYYEVQDLGFNYRITDFQCELGKSQLARLTRFIVRRRAIAFRYAKAFADCPELSLPREREGFESAWHLYPVRLKLERLSAGRGEIFRALHRKGLAVQVHYIPIHLQPLYRKQGWKKGDFPRAEAFYESEISLPIFPTLTDADAARVARTMKSLLKEYAKR